MLIGPIRTDRAVPGRVRLSAYAGERELWFEIPDRGELPATYGDSFMIMGLAGSMLRNEPLVVADENPVSAMLVANLREAQNVLHGWNRKFRMVEIQARTAEVSPALGRMGSMYSGGVDSIHTLWKYRSAIDDAVYIGGFDFEVGSEQLELATARNRRIVETFGKNLLVVHSNQKAWGMQTGVARNFWHSAYLAAASLFLRFDEVLISAGHTYAELEPMGCHPVLDPLWSNGTTKFRHVDREFRRSEKLANIASASRVLEELHVCWYRPTENCGYCDKCVRTMVTLNLLGLDGPFPRRVTMKEISRLRADNWDGLSFLIDNALLAAERGQNDALRALKKALRRYDREKALEHFDRGVLGGLLHRLRKRFRPYDLREGLTNGRPDTELSARA